MHPAYIQKAARHKCAESSVTYIEASLSKALKANDLLSGINPSEGWGSRYSSNIRFLSRFLPEKFIKELPTQADNSLEHGNSMNSTTSTSTSGSLPLENSLDQDNTLDTVRVGDGDVKTKEASTAEADPSPRPTLNIAALEALQTSGKIKATFPWSVQKKEVTFSTPPPSD